METGFPAKDGLYHKGSILVGLCTIANAKAKRSGWVEGACNSVKFE